MKFEKTVTFSESVFSSLAGAGPLINFAILISYAFIYAGIFMSLSFIFAFILYLFFFNTLYQLSKEKVTTGSYYEYLKNNSMLKNFIFIYYVYIFSSFVSILIFLSFILFPFIFPNLNEFIEFLIFIFILFMIYLFVSKGIRPSVIYGFIGSLLEILIIIFFSFEMISNSKILFLSFKDFNLNNIFIGSLFSVLIFAGIGAPLSFGDEIIKPEKVKNSLFLATIIEGVLFILASFSISFFISSKDIFSLSSSPVPILNIIEYFGIPLTILFLILLINSFINILNFYGISLTRTLYRAYSDLKFNSIIVISFLIILFLTILFIILLGPLNGFLLSTSIATVNWLMFHDALNFSLIISKKKDILFLKVLPIISLILSGIMLYFIIISLQFPFFLAPLSTVIILFITIIFNLF